MQSVPEPGEDFRRTVAALGDAALRFLRGTEHLRRNPTR